MHSSLVRFTLIAAVAALPLSAVAQTQNQPSDNRYGTWSPPGDATNNGASLNTLLKKLNKLIKDAEKSRAADPTFLRDLKKLTARYANPWTQVIVSDNFSDGDFNRAPRWSVTSGEYWVEKDYGLRARVTAPATSGTSSGSSSSQTLSKEKLALSILGAVLNGNKNTTINTQPRAHVSKPSAIETRARVSNSFKAVVKLSSWKGDGTFAIALNQGIGDAGYRVVYATGLNPALSLVKVTQKGRAQIATQSIRALEDNNPHALAWTRTKNGTMTVRLDGKVILKGRDTSFRDGFDTLQLSGQGSDVIVKSVVLKGTR